MTKSGGESVLGGVQWAVRRTSLSYDPDRKGVQEAIAKRYRPGMSMGVSDACKDEGEELATSTYRVSRRQAIAEPVAFAPGLSLDRELTLLLGPRSSCIVTGGEEGGGRGEGGVDRCCERLMKVRTAPLLWRRACSNGKQLAMG